MVKLFGIILIASASIYISFSVYAKEKKAIENLSLLYDFSCYLNLKIKNSRAPLAEIIRDFSKSTPTAEIFNDTTPETLLDAFNELFPDVAGSVEKIFDVLYDSPSGAAEASAELSELYFKELSDCQEHFEKIKKTIIFLPPIAGAMLIILLV